MIVFGVIAARGGSKGLSGKNLRSLGGLPMIGWSIRAAQGSRLLTRWIVSTDDPEIVREANALGAQTPFLRPPELARDDSSIIDALRHAVLWLERSEGRPDIIVLLQATSPLRTSADIDETIQLLLDTGADSVQTVVEDTHHPLSRFTIREGRLTPLIPEAAQYPRRQDAPPIYRPSGAVYAARYPVLMDDRTLTGRDHRGLVRDFESSVDIDSIWDFRLAESILEERLHATAR